MNQTQHITTNKTHIQTWVSREFKEHFARVAKAQGLSESALLRRLLENVVVPARKPDYLEITAVEELPSSRRVSVRLRADDLLLLHQENQVEDHSQCKGDRQPAMRLPYQSVPVQFDLLCHAFAATCSRFARNASFAMAGGVERLK